ncbi:hypothetical protein Tco_0442873 [Tanacetum coccineum]
MLFWNHVKGVAGMAHLTHVLEDILSWLIPLSKSCSVKGVLPKLVFAATSYFIWQEQNLQLFQNKKWTGAQFIDIVIAMVRLKLLSFRFKKSNYVDELMEKLKIPISLVHDVG